MGAQLGDPETPVIHPTDVSNPPVLGPTITRGASTSGGERASNSHEGHAAVSEPLREKEGPVPARPSLMNNHRIADRLLSTAVTSAIQGEIRRTNPRIVSQECGAALLRVVNVLHHSQKLANERERLLDRYRREARVNYDRAVKAEDDLKLTRAGEAERHEIVRSQARATAEASQQQMHKAIEHAFATEAKLMAADAELADVKARFEESKNELKSAEEKIEIAEAVARLADIKVAEAVAAARTAEKRAADAAEKAIEGYRNSQAFLKEMAEVTEKAVESFRNSQAFSKEMAEAAEKAIEGYRGSQALIQEVAEAGAGAYLHGFYHCRSKAMGISDLEGLKDLEPDEDSEDEEVEGKSAPSADAAPPADMVPANN